MHLQQTARKELLLYLTKLHGAHLRPERREFGIGVAENTALGIAILSYNGQLNFGLVADYKTAVPELMAALG